MAIFTKQEIQTTYRNIAGKYDLLSRLLLLIGLREKAYRKHAVAQLRLEPGNTVVELGCGTGMNFPLLQNHVGPTGRIVGIDYSEAMLAEARKRIDDNGWKNISLVQCDAADYEFTEAVDGIISTFSLVFMPDYEGIIEKGSQGIKPGRRFVVLDQKIPSGTLRRYSFLFDILVKPFAVTAEMSDRRPWQLFDRYFDHMLYREFYLGFLYLAVGKKSNAQGPFSEGFSKFQQNDRRNITPS